IPPSAAPEWLRVGWIFETSATSAPASCASIAARMPAQPAPTTRTSCVASTTKDATQCGFPTEFVAEGAIVEIEGASAEQRELLEEILARMPGTRIEALRLEPCDLVSWEELASFGIARGDPRYAKPIGVALVGTEPEVLGVRGELEAELLACAFRDGAEKRGWPRVFMVAN